MTLGPVWHFFICRTAIDQKGDCFSSLLSSAFASSLAFRTSFLCLSCRLYSSNSLSKRELSRP